MSDPPKSAFDPLLPARPEPAGAPPPLLDQPSGRARAEALRDLERTVERGVGERAVQRLRERGKNTGWERIERLCDQIGRAHV